MCLLNCKRHGESFARVCDVSFGIREWSLPKLLFTFLCGYARVSVSADKESQRLWEFTFAHGTVTEIMTLMPDTCSPRVQTGTTSVLPKMH